MAALLDLCADVPVRRMRPRDVLIRHGAINSPMFVLMSGSVTFERDDVVFARIDHAGAVFGEIAAVLDRPASATVRAETDVEAHVIYAPRTFLLRRPELMMEVLRMTAARLEGMTRYLVDARRQLTEESGDVGLVDHALGALLEHEAPPLRARSSRNPDY
jgi:CRP-like cAMP-binding protein